MAKTAKDLRDLVERQLRLLAVERDAKVPHAERNAPHLSNAQARLWTEE